MKPRRILAALVPIAIVAVVGLAARDLATGPVDIAPDRDAKSVVSFVATDGDDEAPGTAAAPWATIQHAASVAKPGSTVLVAGGTYRERVSVGVSGSTRNGFVTIRNAPGATPVLDGSGMDVPPGGTAMITIEDRSWVRIQGFEIRNLRTDQRGEVPIGISVTGAGGPIQLLDNDVHHIETNWPQSTGGDAHGIAVFGTRAPAAIHDVLIDGNELRDLRLGSSEALVVNGNVRDFTISDNVVHDANNIGIDVIGYEGTAPDPSVDAARGGLIRGNLVYDIDSYGNPAYGRSRSADGIYVDGGRDIVVEANTIHDVNIGLEFASERAGRATSYVTARSNLVYDSSTIGLAVGGYDRRRGHTDHVTVVNNTFVNNGVEFLFQFDTRNTTLENNVVVSNDGDFLENPYRENLDNVLDHNLYWIPGGSRSGPGSGSWEWKGRRFRSFEAYRSETGQDADSIFADPRFVDATGNDFRPAPDSRLVDAGHFTPVLGSTDAAGAARVANGEVDLGAFEVPAPEPEPTPSIQGPVEPLSAWEPVRSDNGWGPVEADRSNGEKAAGDGGTISIAGRTFDTGIGVHAPSELRYALGGRCTAFLADVGVDDEVDTHGTVSFEIWVDGERAVSSGTRRGGDEAFGMYADLTGVRTLRLVVTDGGNGNAFDHADWAGARIACGA